MAFFLSSPRPNASLQAIRHPNDDLSARRKPEPKLVFIARRAIKANEELLIDYGETNPAVLQANPWLLTT